MPRRGGRRSAQQQPGDRDARIGSASGQELGSQSTPQNHLEHEDVVLAVLAHEFGHVIERHALRHIMRSAVVAMGVSLLVGAEESILEEIVGFGGGLVLSGQSREFELAADHVSADWMRQLGHDTDALARFFQRLADDCGPLCDGGGLMASHPSFADRIRALEHQSD